MRLKTQLDSSSLRPDLTPLIDVVFLLLIFFMLTASFVEMPSALVVALPETASAAKTSSGDMVVTVTADNTVWVDGGRILSDQLTEKLHRSVKKERLTIKGDRQARWGSVVDVWDAGRIAGFSEVHVATSPRKEDALS